MDVSAAAAPIAAARLARFILTAADAEGLALFYEQALGFRRLETARRSGAAFESLMGVTGGAVSIALGLGEAIVELLQFDRPGRPYPEDASSSDLNFQHFAIVASDIDGAYRRLCSIEGWRAISSDGPQRLPPSSGGVAAFKFRDPEGHPLELLAFPEGQAPAQWRAASSSALCLGVDHSAISVADVARSVAFYEKLGLTVAARSLNQGPEQQRLDGAREPPVDVVALAPRQDTPHIELLGYRFVLRNAAAVTQDSDIAATRLVLEAEAGMPRALVDPDGHRLLIVPPTS